MRSHCLSAPNKSAFESRVRSILPAPDLSDFDSTAKYGMSPQGRRANRYVQTIPFPCIAFEVRNGNQPALRAVRRTCSSLSGLSRGAQSVAVSEACSMLRYRCSLSVSVLGRTS